MKTILFVLSVIVISINLSCSLKRPKGQTEAEILYKESKQFMEDGQYLLAIEKLNKIQSEFPFSYYATPSELLRADIYFAQKNFQEAAASYKVFLDLHPRHEKESYVLYKLSESYFKQLPSTHDRDLESGKKAIVSYKRLLRKFPNSSFVKDARLKINECKEMIKLKEMYVADFYFRTKVFVSARYRYLGIIKDYKEKPLINLAIERVLWSSYRLKEFSECSSYYKNYRSLVSGEYKSKIERLGEKCRKALKNS
tara:strand:+ start:385 stop:1146 length:762 start_codon:yes stop_codon:yes gene_type:complete